MDKTMEKEVKDYYGKIAKQGVSCCAPELAKVEASSCGCGEAEAVNWNVEGLDSEDVFSLGCGIGGAHEAKEGETVLDLGSGTGLDVFRAAKFVGEAGRVIGLDMTDAMLEKARANAEKIGATNVEFKKGNIKNIPLEDNSVDYIISNCVINLTDDKRAAFREAYRVLKPGGRMVVQDIVTSAPLPESVRNNAQAWSSCIGGAIPKDEYHRAVVDAGFSDVELDITNQWNIKGISILSALVKGRKEKAN